MHIGFSICGFNFADGPAAIPGKLNTIAGESEEAGINSLWVMDHFFQIPQVGPAENPVLEAYTTLGYLAGRTSRVQLGTMVTGVTYRNPGLLVKEATTLDVLSGGRAILGIGAAWFEREHAGLGFPFPSLKERFERLEETLQIAQQMWSSNVSRYEGTHYQLEETLCSPPPISAPHPPILIGGSGEKKTLRFVARYANGCNLFSTNPTEVRHKLEVLQEHCDTEGTSYDAIKKTILHMAPIPTDKKQAEEFIENLQPYVELGIDEAILGLAVENPAPLIQTLGDHVIPQLRE